MNKKIITFIFVFAFLFVLVGCTQPREEKSYFVMFDGNGGTLVSGAQTQRASSNSKIVLPTYEKEGYTFDNWYIDNAFTTLYNQESILENDLYLYAKWISSYEFFTIDNMTYIYYGTYPQTVVDDSALIASLNTLTSTNTNGYYEYQGEEYAMVATPYSSGYKFMNGAAITLGQTYYFKVEPIKWRVLEEVDGTYTLLSEYIIDQQVFYISSSTRTIDGKTIYPNNYEHSTIREWLNNDFYNQAFSTPEKDGILTTLVDNSASTTESSTNPYFSNNTMDKVYLLSYQEAISSTYGFDTNSTRIAITTDYARARGASRSSLSGYYGNGYWWLRSPYFSDSIDAYCVYSDVSIYSINIVYIYSFGYGARPAIKIG